ncbi:hypothetical protein J1N35_041559, partial [Gossypium stocksii]
VRVCAEVDVVDELKLALDEGVEEPTHFPNIVLEKLVDKLHEHIQFIMPEAIVPQDELWSWIKFGEKWLVM